MAASCSWLQWRPRREPSVHAGTDRAEPLRWWYWIPAMVVRTPEPWLSEHFEKDLTLDVAQRSIDSCSLQGLATVMTSRGRQLYFPGRPGRPGQIAWRIACSVSIHFKEGKQTRFPAV